MITNSTTVKLIPELPFLHDLGCILQLGKKLGITATRYDYHTDVRIVSCELRLDQNYQT